MKTRSPIEKAAMYFKCLVFQVFQLVGSSKSDVAPVQNQNEKNHGENRNGSLTNIPVYIYNLVSVLLLWTTRLCRKGTDVGASQEAD